jgi:glycosyltransferase involved in cell wall biosynthesis
MRIAMVSQTASPLATGGQSVYVAELSAALSRQGHQVTVYTRRDAAGQPELMAAPGGYQVVHLPAGPARQLRQDKLLQHTNDFGQLLSHCLQVSNQRPEVVQSHHWLSGMVSVLAGRAHGIPVVHTFHGLGVVERRYRETPAFRLEIERAIGRAASRVTATSSDEVFELARMGVPRGRISVVPGGVDTDHFTTDGPAARKTAPQRIVSVGRLVPHKGFAELIEILPTLPDVELVIAGVPEHGQLAKDPEARRLRAMARKLAVAKRVHLTGPVGRDELPELLRSADVVACVPWQEPFGMTALEAMACGVPVLATAVGGLVDTVVDGITGLHVTAGRPREMAVRLRTLLANPGLRAALGAAGRDRAVSRYTWDRGAIDTLRAYQRCPELADHADLVPISGSRR